MSRLDPSSLKQLESLSVRAKVIVEGALTGMHRAKLRGSSVEFAEHKEYSPGDEIRHIDWQTFARTDRYYVKQFEQESELCGYLVLDASASMSYAGKGVSKLDYGSNLIAALAYLLIKQRDRVGLSVFGEGTRDAYLPPRAKPAQLHQLLGIIEEINQRPAQGNQSLSGSLTDIAEASRKRKGLVVVASDFFEEGDDALRVLRELRSQGHDTVVFHLLDRDEIEFPFDELTVFEGLEGGDRLLVDPPSIRKRYREQIQAFLTRVRKACTDAGVEYHLCPTDRAYDETLQGFLARRLGRTMGPGSRPGGGR